MSYPNSGEQTKCLHAGKPASAPPESSFLLCAPMVDCIHVFPCTIPPSQSVDGNKLIGHRPVRLETPAASSWCRTAGYQLPTQCPVLVCLSPLLILGEETRDNCLSVSIPERTGWHLLATLWLFSKQSQEKGTQRFWLPWKSPQHKFLTPGAAGPKMPSSPLAFWLQEAHSLPLAQCSISIKHTQIGDEGVFPK